MPGCTRTPRFLSLAQSDDAYCCYTCAVSGCRTHNPSPATSSSRPRCLLAPADDDAAPDADAARAAAAGGRPCPAFQHGGESLLRSHPGDDAGCATKRRVRQQAPD